MSRRQRVIVEVFLASFIAVCVVYSLIAYLLAAIVDFPALYKWEGDYLVVGYVVDYETQPIVVVVENFLYKGSMMIGGGQVAANLLVVSRLSSGEEIKSTSKTMS